MPVSSLVYHNELICYYSKDTGNELVVDWKGLKYLADTYPGVKVYRFKLCCRYKNTKQSTRRN